MEAVTNIEQVQDVIRTSARVRPVGGATKPALASRAEDQIALRLNGLSGVVEYEPSEFTFTALAGTPVADVQRLLAEQGQQLPFDPPFAQAGSTLGGMVAAGLSGPCRYRFGGVRDFILGVRVVTGEARIVRGGGKVVKNAAGFDIPKLMVGSLGKLGIIVEVNFKVFPRPEAHATLKVEMADLESALEAMAQLTTSSMDAEAIDLDPPNSLCIRLAGMSEALPPRIERLQKFLGQSGELLDADADQTYWRNITEFTWAPHDASLIKVPLTIDHVARLETSLAEVEPQRRYSVAGNVAWLAWPRSAPISNLESILQELHLSGLVIRGTSPTPFLANGRANAFAQRLLTVFDPNGKFAL